MPHCVIEHSANLDSHDVVQKVFAAAVKSELFAADGSDIKVRALSYQHYLTGNSQADFIHVTMRILSGRSPAQKAHLSQTVVDSLSGLLMAEMSISVEVVDIERESYCKIIG
ncbi:MAG: 5-carboxymethyl-2-hydroxymuconate Delta-isomerase [Gammaproteobacteria bacterium]|nr:5-carboxymethyl-2-hydroxymuconate Delta-isomerase [Gammaproteobacteria bacterium]